MTAALSEADRCSHVWDDAGLPAWGTAPHSRFWVALEQPGPWGAKAATQSHLDPELGQALDAWCTERGGRLVLIRRPGHHADLTTTATMLVGGGSPAQGWLGSISLEAADHAPAVLSNLDLDACHVPAPLHEHPATLLVCTNGRRDACCAMRGRPLGAALAAEFPGQVWETSHLNGHRFAPTALLLPSAQLLGRLDVEAARTALGQATQGKLATIGVGYERGRTALAQQAQVADIWARDRWQISDPTLMQVSTHEDEITITAGQHTARVRVSRHEAGDYPASCGKAPVPTTVWDEPSELDET
jgi:hypothetical protein